MSSKAPSKSKTSTKAQTAAKARKGSSSSPSTAARSKASARSRAASKKITGAASGARRAASRPESKEPEAQEGDTAKSAGAAGRTKSAKAAKAGKNTKNTKAAKETKAGGGAKAKAKRTTRSNAAAKSEAVPEVRQKKKAPTEINGFAVGDHVVYPAHGVGRITGIDERAVGEQTLQMFVVAFEKDKMTLMVPTQKVESAGMRRLSSRETMDAAITTLRGRARQRRVMWSRRAQEYEAKLNSGDPVAIAEVVRDLHRNVGQPDQSYSERQMYEAALDRLSREFAAVDNTDAEQAANKLEDVLRAA